MSQLAGKVALITGGARGIGRATAELFAAEGATVVVGDKDEPKPFDHESIEFHGLDVTKLEDWERAIDDVFRRHRHIDSLFNNAGLVGSYEPIDSIALDDWRHTIDVNVNRVFYGIRTVVPVTRRTGGGSIVNVSSIWGNTGVSGVAAYQASKGAVRTLTKNAAVSYVDDGIRVNSVHPGLVDTPLVQAQAVEITEAVIEVTPMRRAATAREIAYAALFLASDESSFMTGAELVFDGGYTAQ